MKPSFAKRVRRAVKGEFRRIRDELRPSRPKRRKPPLTVRLRHRLRKLREFRFRMPTRRKSGPRLPPLSKRIQWFFKAQAEKYRVVLSAKYLVIALNSTALFLLSFFIIHFLTHTVTAVAAGFCEISTTLNYTMVDFHIRYWDWTPEMVIIVFSTPAIFATVIAILAAFAFRQKTRRRSVFWRLRYLTKKQRYRRRREDRKRELEKQVERLQQPVKQEQQGRIKKRISWPARLFLLWTLYHSITYLFSGMLFAFLFHRRFGYVIWYAFNNFFFDALFSVIAFTALLAIGWYYAAQFFNSGKMYFNDLNDRNRMPFMVSQALIPFAAGTLITIVLQIPKFDPSLILLNFSLFFLLLPIPTRATRTPSRHFDNHPKEAKIFRGWIAWTVVVVLAILLAVKIGIPIHFQ